MFFPSSVTNNCCKELIPFILNGPSMYLGKKIFIGLFLQIFLGYLCCWDAHAATEDPCCIAILATNDVHGTITPQRFHSKTAFVERGGLIALSGYIEALRKHYGERLVLLDAGDFYQGTLISNQSLGLAMVHLYNSLGYQAISIGNHEFDFGALPQSETNTRNQKPLEHLGVLKRNMQAAHFPFLSANLFEKTTKRPPTWPNFARSKLLQIANITVGVIGISTPNTSKETMAKNVVGLDFRKPEKYILEEAAMLKQQGAQLIILLAHMGSNCHQFSPYRSYHVDDTSHCEQKEGSQGELFRLLYRLPKGTVDVAIGGHTHRFVAHWVNGVATIESGTKAQFAGLIEACVPKEIPTRHDSHKAQHVAVFQSHHGIDRLNSTIFPPIELCLHRWKDGTCKDISNSKNFDYLYDQSAPAFFFGRLIEPPAYFVEQAQSYLNAVKDLANHHLGAYLPDGISGQTLAALSTEAIRKSAKTDFAMQARGSIRHSLPAGNVTYGHVYEALPFDNYVVKITLSGKQLQKFVQAFHKHNAGAWGLPSMVGLRCENRRLLREQDGTPLEQERLYTLAINDYMLEDHHKGSQVLTKMDDKTIEHTPIALRQSLIDLLQERYPDRL